MKQKFRRAVFVVVYARTSEGVKYLVLKRKLHWKGWESPKGGIEKNETEISAVKRELFEETGKKALNIKKFNFSGKYFYRKNLTDRGGLIGQNFKLYSAEVEYGNVKIDEKEHSEYKWLDFKKAIKKLTWANQKKNLKIVNELINHN